MLWGKLANHLLEYALQAPNRLALVSDGELNSSVETEVIWGTTAHNLLEELIQRPNREAKEAAKNHPQEKQQQKSDTQHRRLSRRVASKRFTTNDVLNVKEGPLEQDLSEEREKRNRPEYNRVIEEEANTNIPSAEQKKRKVKNEREKEKGDEKAQLDRMEVFQDSRKGSSAKMISVLQNPEVYMNDQMTEEDQKDGIRMVVRSTVATEGASDNANDPIDLDPYDSDEDKKEILENNKKAEEEKEKYEHFLRVFKELNAKKQARHEDLRKKSREKLTHAQKTRKTYKSRNTQLFEMIKKLKAEEEQKEPESGESKSQNGSPK